MSALALRYRAGDRAALPELYSALEPLINSVLGAQISGRGGMPVVEAEDLRQQAYVALAETSLDWQPARRDNFVPYFLHSFPWRIDRYLRAHTPSRRSARLQLHSMPHDTLMEQAAAMPGLDGRDWDEVLACEELMAGLPRLYRLVVRLHIYHGLSFAEAGQVMGLGGSAVHEAFGRALALLRSSLAEAPASRRNGGSEPSLEKRRDVDESALRRCVEAMHRLADGGALPGRALLCREAGLTWRQHREIMVALRASGCVVGRRRGSPGSLACDDPAATLERLKAQGAGGEDAGTRGRGEKNPEPRTQDSALRTRKWT